MKIHAPCGDVYLSGYWNVDINGVVVSSPFDNPNLTTRANYYKRPLDLSQHQRPILVDQHMDLTQRWPFPNETAEEVLTISSIEHFTLSQAKHIAAEAYRVLKPGGQFIFDFPDIPKILEVYADDWDTAMRHLYCSGKNEQSVHKWGYVPASAKRMLTDALPEGARWSGFSDELVIPHAYPMAGIVATK